MSDDRDELALRLGLLALRHEQARRLIEREYVKLARSDRIKMQNAHDLRYATDMLGEINAHLSDHPTVTRGTTRLLARVINALHDVSVGAKPTLFDVDPQALWHSEGTKPTGSTMAAGFEGNAAAAAEILKSVMPRSETIEWLDREAKEAGLLDRLGYPVSGKRIMDWRKSFRQGRGAKLGRHIFNHVTKLHQATIHAPRSDLKKRKAQELARAILDHLATVARGEISAPQERVL
jgi:hypothetical protein